MNIFDIFLTHLKPFFGQAYTSLIHNVYNYIKKIIKYKDKRDLDARLWIQKILLKKV